MSDIDACGPNLVFRLCPETVTAILCYLGRSWYFSMSSFSVLLDATSFHTFR